MRLRDWLDDRTGYRAVANHLLEEPLPKGTGWWFTTGSALLLLIGIQFLTGVELSMYYIPAPAMAYDSVQFISRELAFGWLVRGLHFWGASFIVVAAVLHLLRVFFFGSYKAPREVTWLSGLALLLLVLAFSLSGYLLPWDQKAYWATTVTINIARSTPVLGEFVAGVLRGGSFLGTLTLGRWYAAHVFLLPAAVIVFIVAHIALMRRHGISGPIRERSGLPTVFYPWHAIKDTLLAAAVFALLLTFVVKLPATLDEIANPADSSYVPRPEWYFLALFQLLKYFPGPLEPIATIVIPGAVATFFALVPFLDRGGDRHPFSRGRLPLTITVLFVVAGAGMLTALGLRDMPPRYDPDDWGPRSIAGHDIVMRRDAECARCHVTGGPSAPLSKTRLTKDDDWVGGHLFDPIAIAPGTRSDDESGPEPAMTGADAQSVLAYFKRLRAGGKPPQVGSDDLAAATTFAANCAACHRINGEGGSSAPDLSRVGARRDEASIRKKMANPAAEVPETAMPIFGKRLSAQEIETLARYLAGKR
jgi:ubiquinol-cytochrome c reductase cytochrome b subunit